MDELATSIVGIDLPNADPSKGSRRMEIMLTAPGELVELRPALRTNIIKTPSR